MCLCVCIYIYIYIYICSACTHTLDIHTYIRAVCTKYIFSVIHLVSLKHYEPNIQWGKKVFSQPPIVQVLPLKKMREACNFHHRYTSTMRDKIRKENPENHIVGFLKNLFANYGGK